MNTKKFYGWILVIVFAIVYFLNTSFPMYGGGVINSYMAKSLNISRSALGLGVTFFSLAHSLLAPMIALAVNRLGVRKTLFMGSIVISLGSLFMSFLVKGPITYVLIYGCVIGFGVGLGAIIPIQTGITLWFKKKRSIALSIVLSAAGVGGFIASPLVNKIIEATKGNWRIAWWLVSGLTIISALISIAFVRNKPSDLNQVQDGIDSTNSVDDTSEEKSRVYHTEVDWTVKEAIRTRSLWLIVFASSTMSGSYLMCLAHSVINLMDKGVPNNLAAISMGLITLFSIIGRLVSGFLGNKYEPRFIYSAGLFIFAIGYLIGIFINNTYSIYLYTICTGIGIGTSFVCSPILYGNYFGSKSFASIMGTVSPIQSSIGALSPLLAGLIYDYNGSYNLAFAGASIMLVLGGVSLIFAKPPEVSCKKATLQGQSN